MNMNVLVEFAEYRKVWYIKKMKLIALCSFLVTVCHANNQAVKTSIRALSKTQMVKRLKIPKEVKKYGPILGLVKKELRYKYKWGKVRIENKIRFKKGDENVEASINIPF